MDEDKLLIVWRQGECRGNVPEHSRNPVTWGIFPGQEIAQTTIIEKESFLSWKVRDNIQQLSATYC